MTAEIDAALAHSLRNKLVRFAHERNGGPVHRVLAISSDHMIELNDMAGWFAPHLFAVADDIGGIPLEENDGLEEHGNWSATDPVRRRVGVDPACYDLARHFLTDAYVEEPRTDDQIKEDLTSLAETIQQAVEDWLYKDSRQ